MAKWLGWILVVLVVAGLLGWLAFKPRTATHAGSVTSPIIMRCYGL